MLTILCNGQDVTDNVKRNSLSINKQLSNRINSASFDTFDIVINEGDRVEIWEGCSIREPFAGGKIFAVSDTFSISEKFRPGNKIYVDFDGVGKKRLFVESVDHSARTLTVTKSLSTSYGIGVRIGSLLFSGIVQNAPEEEMTRGDCADPILERTVNVGDWRQLLDRKIVAETYENMYFREILSLMIYKFCSTDTEIDLINFAGLGTASGVINTPSLDMIDRIEGNSSLSFGTSGPGTGAMTYTIPNVDLSSYDKARFFFKVKKGTGAFVTKVSIRLGSGVSDYFEYNINNIGDKFDGHWGLENVILSEPDVIVGAPDLSNISFVQRYFTVIGNMPSDGFHLDILQAITGSFSLINAERGSIVYEDIRVQYKKPSVAIDNFAKMSGDFRHIDNERDIHYYNKNGGDEPAPFGIDDHSQNFGDLRIDVDITNLRNRQTVRGGEAPDETLYQQDEVSDGVEISRRLDYKPKSLSVYIGTGSPTVWTQYTAGIENLVNEATVDFVYNFNEKTIRKTDGVPIPAGQILRREYYPYKPIRVRIQDPSSIAKMKLLTGGDGIYDGAVISEPKIKTFQEARQRAKAEIDTYKNPIVTITFKTNYDGLEPGQIIPILDTDRNVNDRYMIQKVKWTSKNNSYRSYTVTASTTLFGITEFLQLLLKRSDRREYDTAEIVDIVTTIDETISMGDVRTLRQNIGPRYVHSRNLPYNHTLTLTEGGTPNDGYVGFVQLV